MAQDLFPVKITKNLESLKIMQVARRSVNALLKATLEVQFEFEEVFNTRSNLKQSTAGCGGLDDAS